jgi:integrase
VNDKPVFASRFEKVTTLARHSLSRAVRRILDDEKYKDASAKFTPHDLRRIAATLFPLEEFVPSAAQTILR